MTTIMNLDTVVTAERWRIVIEPCYVCHGTTIDTKETIKGHRAVCFHCGNFSRRMPTKEQAVAQWNKTYRFASKVS
jgi:hypothetical protein